MSVNRTTHPIVALAVLAATLVAAWPASARNSTTAPVVSVTETASGIVAPRVVRPGITTFRVAASATGKTQSLLLARLDRGVTYADIQQAMQSGNMAAVFQRVIGEGGIAEAGPHNGSSWTVRLRAGDYLLVDDEANLATPLRVAGAPQAAPAPAAAGTVAFAGNHFRLPPGFGDGTWKLVNSDPVEHELGLIAIAPGHTPAEVEQALAQNARPVWTTPVGTVNLVGPGQSVWVTLHRIHGLYALVDYLPMLQGLTKSPVLQFHRFS